MSKLSKTSKVMSVLLAILFWFLLLRGFGYGFFTLRACVSLLGKPDYETVLTVNGISQNFLSIYSETGIEISRETLLWEYLLSLVVSFLETPLLCYGIHLLRKVLAPMTQHRPFTGTAQILRNLGWVSVILAVVHNAFDYGLVYLYEHVMPVSQLFQGSSITRITFRFQPNMTYILVAVVVFILSAVFCYGEELQQLSDETL